MPKVKETGTYRHKSGHAIHLRKGDEITAEVAKAYTLDGDATRRRAERPEPSYMSGIVDAPQQRQQRAEPPVENRMETPAENRSDAELAADAAAKDKKA